MADPIIAVTFDQKAVLQFVAGEDRLFALQFTDQTTGLPYNLTGALMSAAFPRQGNGDASIKIRSANLNIAGTFTNTATQSIFDAPSHGLVGGEEVTVSAGAQQLPAPFVAGTEYTVVFVTADQLAFSTAGTPILLEGATCPALSIDVPAGIAVALGDLGQAVLSLTAAQSAAIAYGLGQSMQFVIVAPSGAARMVVCQNALDVTAQPWP